VLASGALLAALEVTAVLSTKIEEEKEEGDGCSISIVGCKLVAGEKFTSISLGDVEDICDVDTGINGEESKVGVEVDVMVLFSVTNTEAELEEEDVLFLFESTWVAPSPWFETWSTTASSPIATRNDS